MKTDKSRRFSFIAAVIAFAYLTVVTSHAQSPATSGGRTFELTVATGTEPFDSSGKFRFLPSSTDNKYAIVPITGAIVASSGTYTYTKTDADEASLNIVDSDSGPLLAVLTYTTADSGTYVLTSSAVPGGSQAGTFVMYSGDSPVSIAGSTITVTITGGEEPFSTSGSYRILPAATGNTYSIDALSGDVEDSNGTYTYTKNSDHTGIITFIDSDIGTGLSSELSFDTSTTASVYFRKVGSVGFQTGLLSMVVPVIPVSITAQPASQTVDLGSNVLFTVEAEGTGPLAYQWRKGGVDIDQANSSTFSIPGVLGADQAGYDVVVSNAATTETSDPANLSVVVPPMESTMWSSDNGFSMNLPSQPGTSYHISWSSDLVTWYDLTDFVATGTSTPVQDPGGVSGIRFYRVVSP